MPKISAVLITLNAERSLRQTLESIKWCDEIIVVDSGSSDDTLLICKEYGCKIAHRDFDGYGTQKQYAVSLAENDWVLSVDADEIITDELKSDILKYLSNPGDINGFYLPFSLIFLNKKMRFGGVGKEFILRLFNRKKGNYNSASVHEKVIIEGKTKRLRGEVLHKSYTDIHHYFEKFNRYTTAAAKEQLAQKKRPKSKLAVYLRFPFGFFQLYIFRGGILDGYPGFVWAFLSSVYPVVKYIKHRELNEKNR